MLTVCFSSKATSRSSLQCLARELTQGHPGVPLAGSSLEAGAASSFPRRAQSQPWDSTWFGRDGKVWWDRSCNGAKSQRAASTHHRRMSATRCSRFEREDEGSRGDKWQAANSCWRHAPARSQANGTSIVLTRGCRFTIKLREQGYLGNLKLS